MKNEKDWKVLRDTYSKAINSLTRSLWVLLFLLSPFIYYVSNISVFYGQNTVRR